MADGDFSTEGDFDVQMDIDFSMGGAFEGTSSGSGGQYTSTIGFPFATPEKPKSTPTVPEKTVRPFESFRERRDQRLAQLREIPFVENIAQACWGGVTNDTGTSTPATDVTSGFPGQNFTTKKPDETGDPPAEDNADEAWQEVGRDSEKVEVVSEEDEDVKVWILVATESTLELPSFTVSKTTGSGKTKTTTTFTVPARRVKIKWKEVEE